MKVDKYRKNQELGVKLINNDQKKNVSKIGRLHFSRASLLQKKLRNPMVGSVRIVQTELVLWDHAARRCKHCI